MIFKVTIVTLLSLIGLMGIVYSSQQWITPIQYSRADNAGPDVPPPPIDPPDDTSGNLMTNMPVVDGEEIVHIKTRQDTGEIVFRFTAMSVEPDDSVIRMTKPKIVYYMASNRAMELTALKGVFENDGEKYDKGAFIGDVRVRVFETVDGSALNYHPHHRPAPTMVINFPDDNARVDFDSVQSRIQSLDRIHLISNDYEFKGQGLSLIYNEKTSRIQELIIEHGDFLRYYPGGYHMKRDYQPQTPDQATNTQEVNDQNEQTPAPQTMAERHEQLNQNLIEERQRGPLIGIYQDPETPALKANQPASVDRVTRSNTPDNSAENTEVKPSLADYYRIDMHKDVDILTPDGRVQCDRLLIYIASGKDSSTRLSPMQAKGKSSPHTLTTARRTHASQRPPAAPIQANRFDRELQGAELVARWTGRLVLRPLEQMELPPRKLLSYNDAFLRFAGSAEKGVYIETDNFDRVYASHIDYQLEQEDAHMVGSEKHPLRIESSKAGNLIGAKELLVRLDTGLGYIPSGGKMITRPANSEAPANTNSDDPLFAGNDGMPRDFSIEWSRRLDFSFAPSTAQDRGLRSARFTGDVKVKDPRFNLTTNQLNAEFETSTTDNQRQLSFIQTSGRSVATTNKGSSLSALGIRVTTSINEEGKLQADRMIATGDVIAKDDKQSIEAEKLVAYLSAKREATDEAGIDENRTAVPVGLDRIYAEQDVKLSLEDGSIVRSDTLESDVSKKSALLTGEPVTVTRKDNYFTIPLLHITDNGKRAWGKGAGKMKHVEDPKQLENGEEPKRRQMEVTWTDEMAFDDANNTMVLTGNVISKTTDTIKELHRLDAEKLTLFFSPEDKDEAQAGNDAPPAIAGPQTSRELRTMHAEKNVFLRTLVWEDDQRKKLVRKFVILGDNLTYNNFDQTAWVNGPGTMQISDYTKDEEDNNQAANPNQPVSNISGKGDTVFKWKRYWKVTGDTGKMLMVGDVLMSHTAMDSEQKMRMWTQRLMVDMKTLNEMGNQGLTGGQEAKVDRIEMHGNAQLTDDRFTAAAESMYYEADKQTVRMVGSERRSVYFEEKNQPKPLRAKRAIWHLDDNRWVVEQPLYGG